MTELCLSFPSLESVAEVFGPQDAHARKLESAFDVVLLNRDIEICVRGEEKRVRDAVNALEYLKQLTQLSDQIQPQSVDYAIQMISQGGADQLLKFHGDLICLSASGKPIKAKTVGQKEYLDNIKNHTITLAIGPAGTGKTFLAVVMATVALRKKEVSRIIITRPAVEAGERLGFLPGDLQSKIDPYLRPLYDALYELIGVDAFQKYQEKGVIEVAPLAYMRGRTLDDSFIILDEAQNTTPEQMKMFLTRLGFRSKIVVTGDITQIDLPPNTKSGLKDAIHILRGIDDISITELKSRDVVRHTLVTKVIEAYEKRNVTAKKTTTGTTAKRKTK